MLLENEAGLEVEPAPFHHQWSDSLLHGDQNEALEAFRGSGKTQLVLRAFPMHRKTYPTKACNYIVLIKENTTQAGKMLRGISREHQESPMASFNLARILEDSSEVYHTVNYDRSGEKIEVRIEAYGKGQAIRGISWRDKRPNIIIIDDPQSRSDARSETALQNDWEWFLSDIKFLGNEGGSRIFLIGNNLGEKCIVERVMRNPEILNFRVSRIPRIEGGKCTWPSRDSLEQIDQIRESYAKLGQLGIFYEEVMCQSMAEEERVFQEQDYRYYSPGMVGNITKGCSFFATLDPASSLNPESCYRAITVIAVTPQNYWYVVDAYYGRWDSVTVLNTIFEVVRKWRLHDFGIEKGHYEQVIKPFLMQKMQRDNVFFNVIPLEHARRGTKLERIKMLQPRFKAGQIWFPETAPWLSELKAELAGVTKDAIKSEYIDLVDSLAMHDQIATVPVGTEADRFVDPGMLSDTAPMERLI